MRLSGTLFAPLLALVLSGVAVAADPADHARQLMVQRQLAARDITDARVLAAMAAVPRHRFVPEVVRGRAYDDGPLPIGHEQTISQPYIVAFMTQALEVEPGMKVLEVGTGSGYQAAVLAELGAEVFTIEIVPELAETASGALYVTGYAGRITQRTGDGYRGWPEQAPFDRVMVTAAPDHVPQPLKDQLKVGGKLIIPVGTTRQELLLITRTGPEVWTEERVLSVLFVPMTGEAQEETPPVEGGATVGP